MMQDIDDIINDENDFFSEASDKNIDKSEEARDHAAMSPSADQIIKESEDKEEGIPSLRGIDFPSEFIEMVDRIKWQYRMLPKLDYAAIYNEIAILSIKACPTPTLQVLNDEIQKVQGAKDRLSEIFIDVVRCHNFKKRAVDILEDSWGKFTSEKNGEARKGDASFRMSNFLLDFATVEALLKACTHVLKNLDSLHDSLSRRITVYQLTMKLQDIGRHALPDYDFDKIVDKPDEEINSFFGDDGSAISDDEDSSGKPPLRSF